MRRKPVTPPSSPPIVCNPVNRRSPPIVATRAWGMNGDMIIPLPMVDPIMPPDRVPERVERPTRLAVLLFVFPNKNLYPISFDTISKKTLAAVKPKNQSAIGRITRVRIVATTPVIVAVPSFRVHHVTSIRLAKPDMSQKTGAYPRVRFMTTGFIVTFRTTHKAPKMELAATSRLVK